MVVSIKSDVGMEGVLHILFLNRFANSLHNKPHQYVNRALATVFVHS